MGDDDLAHRTGPVQRALAHRALAVIFLGLVVVLGGIARECLSRGALGDPCAADRDCRSELCARRRGEARGVCTRRCSSVEPCPDDMRCRTLDRCVPRAWDEPAGSDGPS